MSYQQQNLPGQISQSNAPLQGSTTSSYVQSSGLPQNVIQTQTRYTEVTAAQPLSGQQGQFSAGQQGQQFSGGQQGQQFSGQQGQQGLMQGQQAGLMSNKALGNTGIGTITFRPIEGKFNKDKDIIGKMDPYCKFKIGWRSGKSSVAKSQGTNPTWVGDAITLKVKNQEYIKLKVKDKDRLRPDDRIGTGEIPIAPIVQQGTVTQWIPIKKRDTITGEVQVEMTFTPKI